MSYVFRIHNKGENLTQDGWVESKNGSASSNESPITISELST